MEWESDDLPNNEKNIISNNIKNLDILPLPIFTENFQESFHSPMLAKPTGLLKLQGCPYSCGYYCTYGENQGKL